MSEEYKVKRSIERWLKREDKDGTRGITLQELAICLKAENAKNPTLTAWSMFKKLDKNSDGKITKDEVRKNRQQMNKSQLRMEIEKEANNFINTYDEGKDKQISKQEVIAFYEKKGNSDAKIITDGLFEIHDLDKNGFITLEELRQTIKK